MDKILFGGLNGFRMAAGVHARCRNDIHKRVRINSWSISRSVLIWHSISSVMISRLVLNLRHPSLVSQAKRTSQPDQTDELAYPDMIFTGRAETMNLTQVDSFNPSEGGRQPDNLSNLHRGPGRPNNYGKLFFCIDKHLDRFKFLSSLRTNSSPDGIALILMSTFDGMNFFFLCTLLAGCKKKLCTLFVIYS
jgi:hypothetical protein